MSKKAETHQEEASLENFTWDTGGSDDFFGVKGTAITDQDKASSMEEVIAEVVAEDDDDEDEGEITNINDKAKDKPKPKEKAKPKAAKEEDQSGDEEDNENEEEEEEHKFFDDPESPKDKKDKVEKEEGKEGKEKKDKVKPVETEAEKTDGQFFKQLTVEMKDRGFFQTVEIPEDKEELTEDEFFDFADQEIEGRVNETFEAFAEDMDQDGKDFLKFKKNGGRTTDFTSIYVNSPVPDFGEDKEFDSTSESHRKVVIETYLTLVEKMDDEELSDRLEWLKENGKDESYSKKYYDKLVSIDTKQKAALLAQQEAKTKEKEEGAKKFNKTLSEALNNIESVGKFRITKDDKKKLVELITKPVVKIGKNKYIPSFHNKLNSILKADTPEAINKFILLAKLIENDFDTTDLETAVETKVTKQAKSKLRDAKNGVKPSSSGSYARKSLLDFFNE